MLSLALGDSNTGLDFWMSEPVKNLSEWLGLLRDHYVQQAEAINKRPQKIGKLRN